VGEQLIALVSAAKLAARSRYAARMERTMGWRFHGRLLVVLHSSQNPTKLEWQGLLRDNIERGSAQPLRVMVVSHGGGPDVDQRKQLAVALRSIAAPTVVMTGSAIVRGITTALGFFNRRMTSVGLDDVEGAFRFLELTGDERQSAVRVRRELEQELGIRAKAS
jgi:hypothetical protein